MIYGIFSDVHSDIEALNKTIELLKTEGAEQLICLGDIVGRGFQPVEVVNQIKKLMTEDGLKVLMGNHDYDIGFCVPGFECPLTDSDLDNWRKLSDVDRAFLRTLPYTYEDEKIQCVHASLPNPKEWTYPVLGAETYPFISVMEVFNAMNKYILFCGHSHQPEMFILDRKSRIDIIEPVFHWKDISCYEKVLVDVGSASDPRMYPDKTCVLYDSEKNNLKYLRV